VERLVPPPTVQGVAAAASLAALAALAWFYLWHGAGMSDHGAMGLAALFAMWAVMMVGMMLPSAAPAALLYGSLVRKHAERGRTLPAVWVFVGGYLAVWMGFSAAAALLQAMLAQAALLTPMMASASAPLSGALLLVAGIYQLTPLKQACLGKCRDPVGFFLTRWRSGPGGAFRMGVAHGVYCVGCCWALMLLLFAVGVMNLAWVALVAALVFVEKLLPAGRLTARFAGAALILAGLVVLVRG
jgi:predicted metal-binding membrane protein